MRNADAQTIAALQSADGIVVRDLVTIRARTFVEGADVVFGFWSDDGDVAVQVYNAEGVVELRNFTGSGAVLDIGETPLSHSLDVRQTPIVLSQLDPTVQAMARGHELRAAPVEIHRALLDVETRLAVAPAYLHFIGEIDRFTIETPTPGDEGGVRLICVSDTRQLTRVNHARRGLANTQERFADRFGTYAGQVSQWEIWWGEESARPTPRTSGSGGAGRDSLPLQRFL